MSQVIIGQVLFVLASLCCGMLLIAGYDVLRFLRWLFHHGKVLIWIEDTLYWCLAALPVFCLFFFFNEGIIRWYGLLGILLGAVLYEAGISRPMRKILRGPGNWLKKTIQKPLIHMKMKRKKKLEKKTRRGEVWKKSHSKKEISGKKSKKEKEIIKKQAKT